MVRSPKIVGLNHEGAAKYDGMGGMGEALHSHAAVLNLWSEKHKNRTFPFVQGNVFWGCYQETKGLTNGITTRYQGDEYCGGYVVLKDVLWFSFTVFVIVKYFLHI